MKSSRIESSPNWFLVSGFCLYKIGAGVRFVCFCGSLVPFGLNIFNTTLMF